MPSTSQSTAAPGGLRAEVVPLRQPGAGLAPELNLRILWSAAQWVRDRHDCATLDAIALRAGIPAELLDGRTHWISLEQFEIFLEAIHDLAGSDEAFIEACAHRLADGYGPFRYLLWALTPETMYRQAARTMHLVCRIGRYEVVESRVGWGRFRYHAERSESRLVCLSRKSHCITQPTLWGMPKARLTENACVAEGDAYCEYDIQYYASIRRLPTLMGLLAGGALAAFLLAVGMSAAPVWLALPALGASLGYAFEVRRAHATNLRIADEVHGAFAELARDDADARSELIALQQRQLEWTRLMEEQVTERTATLENLIDRVRFLRAHRETQLRGFSHDLRNPLAVLRAGLAELARIDDLPPEEIPEIVSDLKDSARTMEELLREMMEAAVEHTRLVKMTPETILTEQLPERFGRRLKALAHGKGLRTSVFATRELPSTVELDPLILDRVIDNLLTNAVKYTHRGSIVAELTGTPDFFTLKVSDTGQGIDPASIRNIFRARDAGDTTGGSYGVGLSVVVQLLAQIGGKLEVMSKPEVGTTFWAHFPISPQNQSTSDSGRAEETAFDEVVTIRMLEA